MKTALILAGGKSSRFGQNKALAPFGATSLIEHIIDQLEPLFENIIISANSPSDFTPLRLQVCGDVLPGGGPLAGLHSGLKASNDEYVFVTACDMPNISVELINKMRETIHEKKPDAVVVKRNGFIEPFHAFYSREIIPQIEQFAASAAAENTSCGIFAFLKQINPAAVESLDEQIFCNINSPEDLASLSPEPAKR